jgi:hypothetical protein
VVWGFFIIVLTLKTFEFQLFFLLMSSFT